MKKSIGGILSVFCLLMLLFHPSLAYAGASQGLLLWAQVVLPTLLPFMICSGAIAALGGIPILTGPFRPLLSGVLKLSPQGSFVFMSGLLCGYPMGAKTASDFLNQERISLAEARYLLAVSNHPSPMFVVGYVAPRLLFPAAGAPLPSICRLFPSPSWPGMFTFLGKAAKILLQNRQTGRPDPWPPDPFLQPFPPFPLTTIS